MAQHIKTGAAGERVAAQYLEQKGYIILTRNYRYKKAEVDIIAQQENRLVFVEVKTRRAQNFGYPEESVTAKKESLFLQAAEEYIYQTNWLHDVRFDIISISLASDNSHQIHHIEDAFH
jgi:putative endonuclease